MITEQELQRWERTGAPDELVAAVRKLQHGEATRQQAHARLMAEVGAERTRLQQREVELDALIEREASIKRREQLHQLGSIAMPDAVKRLRASTAVVRETQKHLRLLGIYPAEVMGILQWLRNASLGVRWVSVKDEQPEPGHWVLVWWRTSIEHDRTYQTPFGVARRSELMEWRDEQNRYSITPQYWAEMPTEPETPEAPP